MSKAPQDAHYDNYVGPLLAAAGVDANTLRLCDFIYKSTWTHAVKHEREAQKETAREAMQPLPESVTGGLKRSLYHFPCAEKFMGVLSLEYVDKLREEVNEVATAKMESDAIMELWDVIHAAETAIRSLSKQWEVDPSEQMQRVISKNAERGYYDKPQEAP